MLAFGKTEKIFSSSTCYKQSGMYSKVTPLEKYYKPGAYRFKRNYTLKAYRY